FDAPCPADAVVGPLHFWTGTNANGDSIYGLAYECAGAITITGSPGQLSVNVGSLTSVPRIGTGNGNITETQQDFACPGGGVATGLTGYYGPWPVYPQFTTVNAVKMKCATISPQLIQ